MTPEPTAATPSRLLPNSHRWDTEAWRAIRSLEHERSALVARVAYLDDLIKRMSEAEAQFEREDAEVRALSEEDDHAVS